MARIVAELGRPETPEETAARKAESSRAYRSSKTFRNLIAALLVTVAVVAIVAFGVPRGTPATPDRIDVAAEAEATSEVLGRPVLAATVPDDWFINSARLEGDSVETWTVVYAPDDDRGFLRVAQAFDADEAWVAETLSGAQPEDTVTIDGVTWDEYRLTGADETDNVTYALGTTAGADRILVYGSAVPELAAVVAESLAPGILDLERAAS
jgi:hypothetical protein